MNNFLTDKVKDIRKIFDNLRIDHLEILKFLKPCNPNKFTLPKINIKEVIEYITKHKISNALGHDHMN